MNSSYETYSKALVELSKQIDIKNTIIAPVRLRGAMIAELLMYCFAPEHDGSVFQNVFYASSKTDDNEIKIDEIKFSIILFSAYQKGSDIIYLDERAKSDKLGEGLRKKTREWETKNNLKVNSKYAVLFDPVFKADMCGFAIELSNKQRLEWTSEDEYKKFIYKEDERWFYDIETSKIKNLKHMHDIKMEIDRLLIQ